MLKEKLKDWRQERIDMLDSRIKLLIDNGYRKEAGTLQDVKEKFLRTSFEELKIMYRDWNLMLSCVKANLN